MAERHGDSMILYPWHLFFMILANAHGDLGDPHTQEISS